MLRYMRPLRKGRAVTSEGITSYSPSATLYLLMKRTCFLALNSYAVKAISGNMEFLKLLTDSERFDKLSAKLMFSVWTVTGDAVESFWGGVRTELPMLWETYGPMACPFTRYLI